MDAHRYLTGRKLYNDYKEAEHEHGRHLRTWDQLPHTEMSAWILTAKFVNNFFKPELDYLWEVARDLLKHP